MQLTGDIGQGPPTETEFRPGLVLGVFSLYRISNQSQSVFTVIEGPTQNELTLKWTYLVDSTLYSFTFSVKSSLVSQLGRDLRQVTEQTEALRVFGRDIGAGFEVTLDEYHARVLVYPDSYSADNTIMTLIDAESERVIGTLTGRKLGEGYDWTVIVIVVPIIALVLAFIEHIVAILKCVSIKHGLKVTFGGIAALPAYTIECPITVHKTSDDSKPSQSTDHIMSETISITPSSLLEEFRREHRYLLNPHWGKLEIRKRVRKFMQAHGLDPDRDKETREQLVREINRDVRSLEKLIE